MAHVILWKIFGGTQTSALDLMINIYNPKEPIKVANKRFVPTSITIRYSAKVREEARILRMGRATYKDSLGNKYYLHASDPKIQELNLVGNNTGIFGSGKSIKLFLLDEIKTVKIESDEYGDLIRSGWKDETTQEYKDFIKLQTNNVVSNTMKGKFTFYYPDGVTKYGYISVDDPIIQELNLSVPYTENKKKQNEERSKLAVIANTGSQFYNNGVEMNKFKSDPGGDWVLGQLVRDRSNQIAAADGNYVVYNDGEKNYRIHEGEVPEDSWIKGMKPRKSKSTKTGVKQRGSKVYNDGIKNYRVLVGNKPDSTWTKGWIKN